MQFHGDAKCSSIDAFTAFILKMTVLASGVSMVPMSAKVALRVDTTPCGGARRRGGGGLSAGGGRGGPAWEFSPRLGLYGEVVTAGGAGADDRRGRSAW